MKRTYEYENIQIGNFLVSIGYYLRDFNYSHPVTLSLNQQTPNDPTLGDLFGSFTGSSFLIEFKSHEKNLEREYQKPARKRLIRNLKNEFNYLIKTSIKAHFLCYPTIIEGHMGFNLKPYASLNDEQRHIKNVKNFIELAIESKTVGVSYKEIKKYIKLLENCSKEEGQRDSSGVSSGILMNFDKKEGVKYVLYEEIEALKLKLEQSFDLNRNRVIKREQNNGMSRGM